MQFEYPKNIKVIKDISINISTQKYFYILDHELNAKKAFERLLDSFDDSAHTIDNNTVMHVTIDKMFNIVLTTKSIIFV